MKKVYFKTFGCRTNQFDTQVMMSQLGQYEIVHDDKEADAVIVNSCTVTNGADSSVRAYLNALTKRNHNVKVLFTGCGAYSKGQDLFDDGKVHSVFGHSEKKEIAKFLTSKERQVAMGSLDFIDETIVGEFIGKTRAFIKIQEGCNFQCSYCIIPSVRGLARSHNEGQILEQIETLAHNGFGEFILTGTNVGSYGQDCGSDIATLLKKISNIRGVRRVRIGSLEPIQITPAFEELLDESWMAKHLHIAIQHANNTMLEQMNRRNRVESDRSLFERIATHGYALGTDFIVGFPGESDELWNDAMANIQALPLTHIHAFTYSKRDGTPAALLTNSVHGDIAKQRHHELVACIDEKNHKFRNLHAHDTHEVLIESRHHDSLSGYDQFYNKCFVTSHHDLEHSWVTLQGVDVSKEQNRAVYP